jgi:hypothetical protein
MNEERIPKKISNMKVKGKCPRGRLTSRWQQQVRKAVTQTVMGMCITNSSLRPASQQNYTCVYMKMPSEMVKCRLVGSS